MSSEMNHPSLYCISQNHQSLTSCFGQITDSQVSNHDASLYASVHSPSQISIIEKVILHLVLPTT